MPDKHVIKTSFRKNPNIGLYAYPTQKYLLVGTKINQKISEKLKEVFDLEITKQKVAGTELTGVFLAGNSNNLLAPAIMFEHEVEELKKIEKNVYVFDTKETCLGNNILANDKGGVISTEFTKDEKELIEEHLGVKCKRMDIGGTKTPGSVGVIRGDKCVLHREASEEEKEEVEEVLGLKAVRGSVNMGSPYISSGVIVNNRGLAVGDSSGGPEITHLDESLGFLEIEEERGGEEND